jgi:hypothetical protein
MAGGTLDNQTAPGSWYGNVLNQIIAAANVAVNPVYIPQDDLFYSGPDAQGNITHRSYDLFNRLEPKYINLCNHPYFGGIEEIFDAEGTPFDASMVRTYQRRFRVLARFTTMGPGTVCSCPGVPMPYAPYVPGRGLEWDVYARAVRISARRERAQENEFVPWIVTVDYSTQMPDGGPIPPSQVQLGWSAQGAQNNPWNEPPSLEWDPETETTTPLADRDGKPFLNSAGQPMYPAPAVQEGVAVLVVTKNKQFNTLFQVRQYIEKYSHVVNADYFVGGVPGQVLSLPPKAVEVYRGPLRYWRITHRLKFKKGPAGWLGWLQNVAGWIANQGAGAFGTETWQPKMLDAGFYQFRQGWFGTDRTTLVPIFRGGVQVSQPVPLRDGKPAAPGQETFLMFRYYPQESFADLIPTGKL